MLDFSPTNIILTGMITAVLANSYFAKKYPKLHGQYVYVIRYVPSLHSYYGNSGL